MTGPPEESIKQVKLNTALISYRCSHLPLTPETDATTLKVYTFFFLLLPALQGHIENDSDSVTEQLSGIYSVDGGRAV